jgi:type IV pilus assembly protein PilV
MSDARPKAGGVFLLEALLALVVFSLAMLGLLGLLTHALRDSGSAHWRGEAFDVAAGALSRMWAEDPAALAARYDGAADGPGYRALLAAAMRLPGVTAASNAPRVTIDDSTSTSHRVSVTVYWQLPAEANAHHASVAGVLPSH